RCTAAGRLTRSHRRTPGIPPEPVRRRSRPAAGLRAEPGSSVESSVATCVRVPRVPDLLRRTMAGGEGEDEDAIVAGATSRALTGSGRAPGPAQGGRPTGEAARGRLGGD